MRIACLQFAPQVGDVDNNLNRADSVLSRANPKNLDLLVLPELAFSGYNFRSLQHISPYLEPTTSGITSLWARTTALKHNCNVIVGYPEKVDVSLRWPASPEYYNSAITVNADGETIANYRKSFLYYTDETWALEGPDGFYEGSIPGLGNVAMGICKWPTKSFERMDLNPREPKEPDMETLSYWLSRLEPLIRNEGEEEIICVFANRCGVEEEAVYSGTSAVLGIKSGEVKVYGILGRGEKELLVVDTSKRAQMQLISEPRKPATREPLRASLNLAPGPTFESASPSPNDSTRSIASGLSVDTGRTSTDPAPIEAPTDALAFSPSSPVDHPFKQAFFPPVQQPLPRPGSRQTHRQPTPIPQSQEIYSIMGNNRYGTPAPHSRPSSPKSRNASRSRGPTLVDSPPPFQESPLLGNLPVLEDFLSHERRLSRARFNDNRIAQSTSVDALHHKPCAEVVPEPDDEAEGELDAKVNRPSRSGSENSSQYESSFTRNELGPRSRHVSPRPKSTQW
ncbi:carbon-nitrogen hydrolase [Mollisia scopiformis]|uniref:Carbon-nitrogen hydrolase n=1 Tax=Mollisia scopiformis TaxID=149040 RepID=A0A194XIK4_MOLSC|nr:carbon-nitrogen hydrolase [Mollisia scopiformis]KUJ19961.1 carbon-nitrogen hydrolase [Mollisia scopiformis]